MFRRLLRLLTKLVVVITDRYVASAQFVKLLLQLGTILAFFLLDVVLLVWHKRKLLLAMA